MVNEMTKFWIFDFIIPLFRLIFIIGRRNNMVHLHDKFQVCCITSSSINSWTNKQTSLLFICILYSNFLPLNIVDEYSIFFLLCRLLVVGPVLKWLALFMYLFLRVHSPDQTVIYY